jgi:hypothetical protein
MAGTLVPLNQPAQSTLPCTGKMLIAVSEKYKTDQTKTVFIMAKWTI